MNKAKPRSFECSICKDTFEGMFGNNPAPFLGDDCCGWCNDTYVVPIRMQMMQMLAEARTPAGWVEEFTLSVEKVEDDPEAQVHIDDTPAPMVDVETVLKKLKKLKSVKRLSTLSLPGYRISRSGKPGRLFLFASQMRPRHTRRVAPTSETSVL